jgi:hypothetical protein
LDCSSAAAPSAAASSSMSASTRCVRQQRDAAASLFMAQGGRAHSRGLQPVDHAVDEPAAQLRTAARAPAQQPPAQQPPAPAASRCPAPRPPAALATPRGGSARAQMAVRGRAVTWHAELAWCRAGQATEKRALSHCSHTQTPSPLRAGCAPPGEGTRGARHVQTSPSHAAGGASRCAVSVRAWCVPLRRCPGVRAAVCDVPCRPAVLTLTGCAQRAIRGSARAVVFAAHPAPGACFGRALTVRRLCSRPGRGVAAALLLGRCARAAPEG